MKVGRVVLMAGLFTGCAADRTADSTMLPITRVPKAVHTAAYTQAPGIRFHTAFRLANGDYIMRGLDAKNANVDVRFTPDGQLLTPR
jgi:hypothetical protein